MRVIIKTIFILWACCLTLPIIAVGHPQIHVALLGDSNTFIGGENCDKDNGWSKWFKERFAPASCSSYARSGATWTNTISTKINLTEYTEKLGDNNVIYNQVLRLIESVKNGKDVKPELIIILAGTNDAWFKDSRPQLFSKTVQQVFATQQVITHKQVSQVTSLAESVRYSCETLMEAFPDAQIVLVTPMQAAKAGVKGIRKVGNIIEECGRNMSLVTIRLDYQGCVYEGREKTARRFTSDGIHTNKEGARRNGYFIARQIENVLQF